MTTFRPRLLLVIAIATAFAGGAARADKPREHIDACRNEPFAAAKDAAVHIAACTRIIEDVFRLADRNVALRNRAAAYWARNKAGDEDRAMADLDRAIAPPSTDDQTAYFYRLVLLMARSDFDRALPDLDTLLEMAARAGEPQEKLESLRETRAKILFGKGDYDAAIAQATALIKRGRTSVYVDRGDMHLAKGDVVRAVADYDEAVARESNVTDARGHRGLVRLHTGEPEKAREDFATLSPEIGGLSAVWQEIANRRLGRPSTLAADAGDPASDTWPGPVLRLFLGRSTPEWTLAAASSVDDSGKPSEVAGRRRMRSCQAAFYAAEYMQMKGRRDEAARLYRVAQKDCLKFDVERAVATLALKTLN